MVHVFSRFVYQRFLMYFIIHTALIQLKIQKRVHMKQSLKLQNKDSNK